MSQHLVQIIKKETYEELEALAIKRSEKACGTALSRVVRDFRLTIHDSLQVLQLS